MLSTQALQQAKSLHDILMEVKNSKESGLMDTLLEAAEFVQLLSVLNHNVKHQANCEDNESSSILAVVTPPTMSSSLLLDPISSLSSLSPEETQRDIAKILAAVSPKVKKMRQIRKHESPTNEVAPSTNRDANEPKGDVMIIGNDILHEVRYRAPWTANQDEMLMRGHERGLKGAELAYFVGGFHSTNACNSRLKRIQSSLNKL